MLLIVGEHFTKGAQLYFGGQLITPIELTATELGVKFTLPALVGPALVRVVNPGNQTSNDVFFEVTAP